MIKYRSALIVASIILGAAPAIAAAPTSRFCVPTTNSKGGTSLCETPRSGDAGAFKL